MSLSKKLTFKKMGEGKYKCLQTGAITSYPIEYEKNYAHTIGNMNKTGPKMNNVWPFSNKRGEYNSNLSYVEKRMLGRFAKDRFRIIVGV